MHPPNGQEPANNPGPGSGATDYRAAFHRRAPLLRLRRQQDDDDDFLTELFIACAPLNGMLPPPMLEQQARLQRMSHMVAFPTAMRSIVSSGDQPIGRIMIDWGETESRCVDIAVLPQHRDTRAGNAMLRAWLDVVDARQRPATLMVARDNPARAIYVRLGFVPTHDDDPHASHASLRRLPTPNASDSASAIDLSSDGER